MGQVVEKGGVREEIGFKEMLDASKLQDYNTASLFYQAGQGVVKYDIMEGGGL